MESSPQRTCPHCGSPVAQRAETCLMCGAHLKEQKRNRFRAPQGDLLVPLLLAVAIAALWLWKPWQSEQPQAMSPTRIPPTATSVPSPTYVMVPTATPLNSPTPEATMTLPPNQTRHTVKSGETVSTIAKQYGTTSKAVLDANGLKATSIISVGDELIIPLPVANTSTPTITLTPSPTPFEYTIRSGDTLSAIAKRYATTVEALMGVNGITDATGLRIGTKLIIVQPPDFSTTMAYEIYEVQQGDTLFTLSSKFGVTVAEIKEASGLESDALRVSQELKIPVGTATPTPTSTPSPTLTPTPSPPRPAPVLLAPPDGAVFGPETVILLNWASVGILDEDEWYVVRLRRINASTVQPPLIWTKATSWRLPDDLRLEGVAGPQRFRWQVSIMRQTGVAEDGTWLGENQSPSGKTRTFTWE